jgi:hypothetical protein
MRRLNSEIWRADRVSKSSTSPSAPRFVKSRLGRRASSVSAYSSLSGFTAPQETPHSAVAMVEPRVRPTFEGADVVLTLRLPVPRSTLRFVRSTEARRALRAAPATSERYTKLGFSIVRTCR